MPYYPLWVQGVTPHTNTGAKINRHREVSSIRVVKVVDAFYRGSTFSDTFELEDQTSDDPVKEQPSGKNKVAVICSWYGVKPRTSFPNIDLSSAKYEIQNEYSGLVADNIGG
jgi:hypothetical protein